MNEKLRRAGLLLSAAAILGLAACGGDSSSPPTASTTTSVPVTVIDGAIRNATVCLDMNSNGACDTGEPSGRTDAAGNVNLQVPNADVGKYPIVAIVGTDAVDVDNGPVTIPFTMQAPADKPAVVSPLTTLVQTVIASTGVSSAEAEAAVQSQTGLTVSLFQDFTKSSTAESQTAGTVARMVVVVTQQQNEAIKSTAGTTALDGAVISKADLDAAVQKKLLELLPSLLTALASADVQNATDKEAALLAAASDIVTSSGLTTSSMATVVAINNQATSTTPPAAETPAAGISLATFNFSNVSNWFSRSFAFTAAMNTPDPAGNTKYIERRARSVSGVTSRWNTGSEPSRQADLHYNGTAWVNCGLNREGTSLPRDAGGSNNYDYCDKLETGSQTRAVFDVSGRTIASVYDQIRAAGYTNITIAAGSAALGTATFPSGSKLGYQSNTSLSTAVAYYPGSGNIATKIDAGVAAGALIGAGGPCRSIAANSPTFSYGTTNSTLEELAAVNQGTPCMNNPGVVSTGTGTTTVARNDWWGQSTLAAGVLGSATTGPGQSVYFTTNTLLRVGFASGNVVKYYSCQQRASDGSPRNCDPIGTGTYTISNLGDARIMTLANQPAQFSALNYQRVFVQRGGKVYLGYQSRTGTFNSARLNLVATNAMFAALGLSSVPSIAVDAGITLVAAAYSGDWRISDAGLDATGYLTLRVNANGTYECLWNDPDGSSGSDTVCNISITPATGAVTAQIDDGTFTGTFDFLSGAVTGTFTETGGSPQPVSGVRR